MSVLALITVKTQTQLDALTIQTYLFAVAAAGIFILIAALISSMIRFEGGAHPKDPAKRRMWFWILLFGCFATFFLYNMFLVTPTVATNLQAKFMKANIIGSFVALAVYFILGFILSKVFSTGKLGNWFPSKK